MVVSGASMSDPVDLEFLNAAFGQLVPHQRALGFSVVAATRAPGSATVKLPWDPRLVGNPETEVLHGGCITTLLDAASGISVQLSLEAPGSIATLDLRVDFLTTAPARQDVVARAECYRLTRTIAFVRGAAWTLDPAQPFATATATFALGTRGRALLPEPRP